MGAVQPAEGLDHQPEQVLRDDGYEQEDEERLQAVCTLSATRRVSQWMRSREQGHAPAVKPWWGF